MIVGNMRALALRPAGPEEKLRVIIEAGRDAMLHSGIDDKQKDGLRGYDMCMDGVRCAEMAKLAFSIADMHGLGKPFLIAAACAHAEYGLMEGRYALSYGEIRPAILIGRDLSKELRFLFNNAGFGISYQYFEKLELDTVNMVVDAAKYAKDKIEVREFVAEIGVMVDSLESLKDLCRTCSMFGDESMKA